MAPLVLEGENLGQKHKHLNSIVKTAVSDETWNLDAINHIDPDPNNLLRIDVACGRRDIPYILEVMKSNDLLYVTRAIKHSTWLITDVQYTHIINPVYLEQSLFPAMTAKAKSKLLYSIKQNLKDENRVEEFFNFYKDNPQIAMKWLPGCPTAVIEKFVQNHSELFNADQITILCRKSFSILKIYCKVWNGYQKRDVLCKTTNYLKSNCNEYLDIIESIDQYYKPKFNKNATQIVMDKCRERIMVKFDKYCHIVHIQTFAKNMKSEDVQEFLVKQKQNVDLKYWFKFENVKHFLTRIPKNTRLEFVKTLFMDKSNTENEEMEYECDYRPQLMCAMAFRSGNCNKRAPTNAHIYRWYRYAPFNTAIIELKKLIRTEPLPAERNAIFTVLIKCAGSNQDHLKTLLEYYRNNHINEPFKFKVQFVNSFLSHAKTHEFDDKTWDILNNIFSSMEIHMESENDAPFCIDAIIVYKILHDQDIPDIIEKKFAFNTLQKYRKRLNENQQSKIFNYLYNHLIKTLENQKITNERELTKAIDIIKNMLELLSDWKKNLADYPLIINKIKESIKIKRQNSWEINSNDFYSSLKCWRKHVFEESLILHPSDEACLNALKHDPGLLARCQNEMEMMYSKDSISMERTLKKMRIYWPETIAKQWTNYYLERIEQPKGKMAVKYVCTLMPRHQILPLIEKNAPVETKINWSNASDLGLILKKYIARNMYLVRPSVSIDTVLLYAKGDYLYHSLPSLNAILYNVSSNSTSEYITKLLDTPVSLQKHGICTIFRKLKYSEIKDIVTNLWKNNKNASIKTILFQQTFGLLCKEKNESTVKDLWQLLNMYIESLSHEENRIIYHTFTKFADVPIAVRPLFFTKGYLYMKSLPAKANCDKIVNRLFSDVNQLVDLLEPNFVEDVLLASLEEKFFTKKNREVSDHFQILATYILSCKSEEVQMVRYEKLLLPILQKAFTSWKINHKGQYYVRIRTKQLLNTITDTITDTAVKQNITPVKLYKAIQEELTKSLVADENYEILLRWSLVSFFMENLEIYIKQNPEIYSLKEKGNEKKGETVMPYNNNNDNKIWEKICFDIATVFGDACKNYLKEDTLFNKYPAIYYIAKEVLMDVCSSLGFNEKSKLTFLKAMLSDKNLTTIYCIVVEAICYMGYSSEDKPIKKEIVKILQSNPSSDVKVHMCYYDDQMRDDDNNDVDDENNED